MLSNAKALTGYRLQSLDGEIGRVREFYFDDKFWAIRYLVADTGNWLTGRMVLISPYALTQVSREETTISVNLTQKQIEESPSLDSDKPVSLQFETSYYGYYGWPMYWGGASMWGNYPYIVPEFERSSEQNLETNPWNPHLRSTKHVAGYQIQASDGAVGHVVDFVVDNQTWAIRYLVVDTSGLWTGVKVLIAPHWIESIGWAESKVFVNLNCESIKQSPVYDEELLVTRDYEAKLHRHYGRQGYWFEPPTGDALLL